MSAQNIEITAYLKTHCGWSEGVRSVFRKYGLEFEEKDIIQNPAYRWEMEHKSGQPLSPCVIVNGTMLADVSGAEVEQWMVENGLLEHDVAEADAPTNSSCTDEQHAAMEAAARQAAGGAIRFVEN
ncbi:MAG: glutaredoxin [Verrucomicrobiae bacterium]|nr:glutaredoxin [Verrucomicrobiae bacterium]MCP5541738.1 glutaredoxin [Akkermansiaceae bacterium]MCP5551735.1 glutaredoxin [Akkermansiaceae bacterium]